jgi:hypothetical protein
MGVTHKHEVLVIDADGIRHKQDARTLREISRQAMHFGCGEEADRRRFCWKYVEKPWERVTGPIT